MTVSTGAVGVVNGTGAVQVYVPPNVNGIQQGAYNVSYGTVLNVPDGTTIPNGNWRLISGTIVTSGEGQVQEIILTPA